MLALISSLTVLALFITFTVYLGIYGYNNPDPESCWVIRGLENSEKTKALALAKAADLGIEVASGYPVEMHKVYLAWFRWGFWNNLVLMIVLAATITVGVYISAVLKFLVPATAGLFFCSTLVWIILGFVWRYTTGGSIAAGDWLTQDEGQSDEDFKAEI